MFYIIQTQGSSVEVSALKSESEMRSRQINPLKSVQIRSLSNDVKAAPWINTTLVQHDTDAASITLFFICFFLLSK